MPPTTPQHSQIYPAHPIYRVLALVSTAALGLLAWQLRTIARQAGSQELEAGTFLFLGISLILLLRFARMAAARVTLDAETLSLQLPWATPRTVAFRQISQVHEDGRGIRSILLLYHPHRANGLVDIDQLLSLALPAVVHQDELLRALNERVQP